MPAPILCDNNLSALPGDAQQYIIDRYLAFGVPLLDANSGFEPRTFDEGTYQRWKPILRGVWRFALDETRELPDVERMMLHTSLSDESPRREAASLVSSGMNPLRRATNGRAKFWRMAASRFASSSCL